MIVHTVKIKSGGGRCCVLYINLETKSCPIFFWMCFGYCGTTGKTADITCDGCCMGFHFNTDLHLIL